MIKRYSFYKVLIIFNISFFCGVLEAKLPTDKENFRELSWEDLVPSDAPDTSPAVVDHGGGSDQAIDPLSALMNASEAPVVNALNDQWVRLPGFVVPLELDEEKGVTEFLLVPYFGACIHVPPPPSNQIVHVKMPEGLGQVDIYFPFWISGKLLVSAAKTDLALAGYTMTGYSVEPFE